MGRPRPRVLGKPNPSVSSEAVQNPDQQIRVVPAALSRGAMAAKKRIEGNVRSQAAKRMLMSTTKKIYRKTDADEGGGP